MIMERRSSPSMVFVRRLLQKIKAWLEENNEPKYLSGKDKNEKELK